MTLRAVLLYIQKRPRWAPIQEASVIISLIVFVMGPAKPVLATSGGSPYNVPLIVDTNPDPNIVETTIVAQDATVDIGNGLMANVQTFNGHRRHPGRSLNRRGQWKYRA